MSDVISKLWKSDEGKKRSFKDLTKSLEKIENEFRLLLILGEIISNPKEESPDMARTFKDSFLIHFRRIHNFLYSKDQDADTIIAEDFFEFGEKWKSTRIKEAKIIKAFEKLANRVLLSFSYGDDAVIREISNEDFNNAVDEIRKPFQQFIELNLPVEIPEETILESEDLEELPAMEIEVEVTGKDYGAERSCIEPLFWMMGIWRYKFYMRIKMSEN